MEECERIYADFVVEKLRSGGGCLKFQHLTGHLSQLNERARRMIGTKPSEIMRFLRSRNDLFIVEQNGMISLCASVSHEGSDESDSAFPRLLKEQEGTVIKVMPNFGFIQCKKPKTHVYFPQACLVEGKTGQLLTDILDCGKKVLFNARKVDGKSTNAKYQASKVWFPANAENEVLHPDGFSKSRKTRDTGLYDPLKTEGIGKIQRVFELFAFIMIDNDPKNTVYFTKKEIRNVQNVTDLTKVVKVNDTVKFAAIRSVKKDAKSRWQATQVFVESKENSRASFSRKLEKNVIGKIYPSAKGIIIKFGPSECTADADSCIFYMHGTKVEDVSWEFSDGDAVMLDVVSIKSSPGWKALLCWVGQRPNVVLKEDLGDFSDHHDEMDDIPESGSFTSKTSGVSSEKSYNSESSRNPRYSDLNVQKVHEKLPKQRFPRDVKKSDFHSAPSRSLSRSSKSSLHSQSRRKTHQQKRQEAWKSHGYNHKSQSPHQKFERDSGFGSSQKMNVVQPKKYESIDDFPPARFNDDDDDDYSYKDEPRQYSFNSKKEKEPKAKKYTSWGDTPYPLEDEYPLSQTPDDNLDQISANSKKEKERKSIKSTSWGDSPYPLSQTLDKFRESSPVSDNSEEKYESNNEFSSDEAKSPGLLNDFLQGSSEDESEGEDPPIEEVGSVFENADEDLEGSPKGGGEAIQPYIRRFQNLEGKLLKVYCKYAEVENPRLRKAVPFFWTDFYYKGKPVDNTCDDLKEVLKVGQSVFFDCFEICDDSGGFWNKTILAWVDGKPKIKEITPDEFIKENQLVVSATEVIADGEAETSCSNTELQKSAVPRKKFLTTVDDDDDDSSDAEPLTAVGHILPKAVAAELPVSSKQEIESPESCDTDIDVDSLPQSNYEIELTAAIEKLLSSHKGPKIDAETVVSDVVDFVLKKYVLEDSSDAINSSKENVFQVETLPKEKMSCDSAKSNVSVTDSSVQTIITGEVISLSIFTHG